MPISKTLNFQYRVLRMTTPIKYSLLSFYTWKKKLLKVDYFLGYALWSFCTSFLKRIYILCTFGIRFQLIHWDLLPTCCQSTSSLIRSRVFYILCQPIYCPLRVDNQTHICVMCDIWRIVIKLLFSKLKHKFYLIILTSPL